MTRDEYLQAVVQIIRSTENGSTGLRASTLGNLILRSIPEHWTIHQFSALKDVLRELEARNQVETGTDAKGMLSVRMANATPSAATRDTARPTSKFIRLRNDIWHAFVDHLPIGKRFFQRSTGAILMGQERPPQNESDWIIVPAISQEIQKDWAREFLKESHLTEIQMVSGDGTWFANFTKKLAEKGPALVKSWNLFRSARVAGVVIDWCGEKSIPQVLVTDVGLKPDNSRESHKVESSMLQDDSSRRQVLDALFRMPTHELLDIPIPAKYLIPATLRHR